MYCSPGRFSNARPFGTISANIVGYSLIALAGRNLAPPSRFATSTRHADASGAVEGPFSGRDSFGDEEDARVRAGAGAEGWQARRESDGVEGRRVHGAGSESASAAAQAGWEA